MPKKREIDIQETYPPEIAEAFRQRVKDFFDELEKTYQMPDKPKKAKVIPLHAKARHSAHGDKQ